jgi:hypothetical protein
MWTPEDVALFQKYSKSARDRAYIAMATTTTYAKEGCPTVSYYRF